MEGYVRFYLNGKRIDPGFPDPQAQILRPILVLDNCKGLSLELNEEATATGPEIPYDKGYIIDEETDEETSRYYSPHYLCKVQFGARHYPTTKILDFMYVKLQDDHGILFNTDGSMDWYVIKRNGQFFTVLNESTLSDFHDSYTVLGRLRWIDQPWFDEYSKVLKMKIEETNGIHPHRKQNVGTNELVDRLKKFYPKQEAVNDEQRAQSQNSQANNPHSHHRSTSEGYF